MNAAPRPAARKAAATAPGDLRSLLDRARQQGVSSLASSGELDDTNGPDADPTVDAAPRASDHAAVESRAATVAQAPTTIPSPVPARPAAGGAAASTGRALATPFGPDRDLITKTINLAPSIVDATGSWMRARREAMRRPALAYLLDAALWDLPADVDQLRVLASVLPDHLYEPGPTTLGVRLPRATVERVFDARFELRVSRARGVQLWHAMSGAVALQLVAEGMGQWLRS